MKNIIAIIILSFSFLGYTQDHHLKEQFSIDASLLGMGITYEQPLSLNFLAEVSVGYWYQKSDYTTSDVSLADLFPYTRVTVRRFFDRDNRLQQGKNLDNNRGCFVGVQNKIGYGNRGEVGMSNELHWGVQTKIGRKWLLTIHFGVGYANSLQNPRSSILYPSIGLRVKYVLF